MKNLFPTILAVLAFSLCCGAPLLVSSLSVASLGWLISGPGLALTVGLVGIVTVILWNRRRRKNSCDCDEQG
ncbi:MAG: hypothetical protein HY707_01080 [Ignavibacteriae bacterium]|nr:hypothetical protein [Ignavibacteriota bacterium]